jgi:hypothetical protein
MTLRHVGTVVVVALSALVLAFVAIGTGRGLAAALAALAALFGLALAAVGPRYETTMDALADAGSKALALAPALLIVFFGFNGGGYFPGPVAFAAVVLALVLALRFWLASDPLAGFGPLAAIAAGALFMYTIWTALSGAWSDAPGRALLETDRALLYLLALLLFASFSRSTDRTRTIVRATAAGALLVCTVGLITRVAPDVWPIAPDLQQGRLSYPLTYWNAFGLLAGLGMLLCTHLTCSEREPPALRVAAAAAVPLLGASIYFTFSRGAIAVVLVGLVAYALLARPRALLGGVLLLVAVRRVAGAGALSGVVRSLLVVVTGGAVGAVVGRVATDAVQAAAGTGVGPALAAGVSGAVVAAAAVAGAAALLDRGTVRSLAHLDRGAPAAERVEVDGA